MRRGFSLLELVLVLTLVGLVTLVAMPRVAGLLDRMAVRSVVGETVSFYQTARFASLVRSAAVRVQFGQEQLVAAYELDRDSVFLVRPGPGQDGVALSGTRLVTRLHANGLGAGAANLTLTFRRGNYQETLTLSRLGRVKRWRNTP